MRRCSQELEALIDDHYQGEAQLLTYGAEENLLKLKQMRGTMTDEEALRWQTICEEYRRRCNNMQSRCLRARYRYSIWELVG